MLEQVISWARAPIPDIARHLFGEMVDKFLPVDEYHIPGCPPSQAFLQGSAVARSVNRSAPPASILGRWRESSAENAGGKT